MTRSVSVATRRPPDDRHYIHEGGGEKTRWRATRWLVLTDFKFPLLMLADGDGTKEMSEIASRAVARTWFGLCTPFVRVVQCLRSWTRPWHHLGLGFVRVYYPEGILVYPIYKYSNFTRSIRSAWTYTQLSIRYTLETSEPLESRDDQTGGKAQKEDGKKEKETLLFNAIHSLTAIP